MNLYGQAQLTKHLKDQKVVERNYWRIFRELEEAKKTIIVLETENKKLKEGTKIKKLTSVPKKEKNKASS